MNDYYTPVEEQGFSLYDEPYDELDQATRDDIEREIRGRDDQAEWARVTLERFRAERAADERRYHWGDVAYHESLPF